MSSPADISQAQRLEIRAQTALLIELNEPEAWLECLRRISDRQAKTLAHGLMSDEASSKRWRRLADAIERVQAELEPGSRASQSQPQPDQA